MEHEEVVERLKHATGWEKVYHAGESYVFKLDISEMRMIKGVQQGKDNLYLAFEEFSELPISFLIQFGDVTHQYWTVRNHLHRANGKPSYVSFDPGKERIIRRWHWHGMLHRTDGPAKEMIRGPQFTDIQGIDGYRCEQWEEMALSWHVEGIASRYPVVGTVEVGKGQRIRNIRTKKIESPREDLSAFTADNITFLWEPSTDPDLFHPMKFEMGDFAEWYEDGKVRERSCGFHEFTWRRGDQLHAPDTTLDLNDAVAENMLSMLGLWGTFADEEAEFLLYSEIDRLGITGV